MILPALLTNALFMVLAYFCVEGLAKGRGGGGALNASLVAIACRRFFWITFPSGWGGWSGVGWGGLRLLFLCTFSRVCSFRRRLGVSVERVQRPACLFVCLCSACWPSCLRYLFLSPFACRAKSQMYPVRRFSSSKIARNFYTGVFFWQQHQQGV